MAKIVDPDNLGQGTSVTFLYTDALARRIDISSSADNPSSLVDATITGSNTGVSLQALYSFCKEQWKTDANLIKLPFPFISITRNQFDVINNWDFQRDVARYLIRDAGWSVRSGSANTSVQEWSGILTLGSLDTSEDQVYYLQSASLDTPPINFQMPGTVNQAVQVYSGSSEVTLFDYRDFMTIRA